MRILAVDVGDKRIGLALSDPAGIIASSLPMLRRIGPRKDVEAMLEVVRENEVELILIGLPILMSGAEGEQATKARSFGEALRARTKVNVEYWDERFSTVEAYRIMAESGVRKSARRGKVDSVSAAVILQSYLDSQASPKPPQHLTD